MIGLMKKASCMMLPTMGGMSRKREQNAPSSTITAIASTAQSSRAGSTTIATGPGHIQKIAKTPTMTMMLCANTSTLRTATRIAYSRYGIRIDRIMIPIR